MTLSGNSKQLSTGRPPKPVQPEVLDGEIVGLDEKGHPRFEWLVNRGPQKGTLVFYVFDLLSLDDTDLRQLPLENGKLDWPGW